MGAAFAHEALVGSLTHLLVCTLLTRKHALMSRTTLPSMLHLRGAASHRTSRARLSFDVFRVHVFVSINEGICVNLTRLLLIQRSFPFFYHHGASVSKLFFLYAPVLS